jgi:hypothetical protein
MPTAPAASAGCATRSGRARPAHVQRRCRTCPGRHALVLRTATLPPRAGAPGRLGGSRAQSRPAGYDGHAAVHLHRPAVLQERLPRRLRDHPRGRRDRPGRRGRGRDCGGATTEQTDRAAHPAHARPPRSHHGRRTARGRPSGSRSTCTSRRAALRGRRAAGDVLRTAGLGATARRPLLWRRARSSDSASYDVRVHHTPGHSPGGVCLQVGERGEDGRTCSSATRSSRARSAAPTCPGATSPRCSARSGRSCSRSATRPACTRVTESRRRSAGSGRTNPFLQGRRQPSGS